MYKRVILKLSGETLAPLKGSGKSGCYDEARIMEAARTIREVTTLGVRAGVVLGGGNIWRGRFSTDMDPVAADQMGMLATIMNALCLSEALTRLGVANTVFSAQEMNRFTRLYTADAARACLNAGGVALLSGGTGNPFFTTDTGAALRAAELNCEAVFKGTTVRGVFDKDPNKYPGAVFLPEITYADCLQKGIRVMDATAFQICMERGVQEIRVFDMGDLENVVKVARGEAIGSRVHA